MTLCWLLGMVLSAIVGFWLGHRLAKGRRSEADSLDQQHALRMLRSLANWTSQFAGNVSKVQSELKGINRQLTSHEAQEIASQVVPIVRQMIDANDRLQAQLEEAEKRFERQAQEVAGYLTEANTDGLTGLANRRAFDRTLSELHTTSIKEEHSVSIILIDLDRFKNVNDTWGHAAGDQVLRQFADRLKIHFPEAIQIARYGGEEFVVLLAGPLATACEKAERFRHREETTPYPVDRTNLVVTHSSGIAEIRHGESADSCLQRADAALYEAKAHGRNRVCTHDGQSTFVQDAARRHPSSHEQDNPQDASNSPQSAEPIVREVQRDRLQQRIDSHLNVESPR
jgi:diguanylate cyclase (GGDEF)-like protein